MLIDLRRSNHRRDEAVREIVWSGARKRTGEHLTSPSLCLPSIDLIPRPVSMSAQRIRLLFPRSPGPTSGTKPTMMNMFTPQKEIIRVRFSHVTTDSCP